MADYTMNVKVIHLTKSTSDWASFTTVIPAGMLCIETTTTGETKQKVGDGTHTFANLPYVTTREMTGATALADGVSGMVPAPQAGDQNKYLSGAGTWEELPEESIPVKYRVKEGTRIGTTGATDSFTLQVSTDNGVTWSDVNTDQGSGHTTYSLGLFATTASGDDEVGKIKSALLPSYVDDVIEGYYDSTSGKFYEESTHTTEITPAVDKIYVDITTGTHSGDVYRWSGSAYICISNPLTATIIYQLMGVDTTDGNFDGTNGTAAGQHGLVPAPATTDAGKFLNASGSWEQALTPNDNLTLNCVASFT